jgi:predicted ATP-dependent endonuclease of OLD family
MLEISKVIIRNFRLLKDVELALEKGTTLIVGRNNSGKTSLTEIFRRFIQEKETKFRLEDFSFAIQDIFEQARNVWTKTKDEKQVRSILPTIELEIVISYTESVLEFGPLSEFIIDLDSETTEAHVLLQYRLKDGAIEPFFQDLENEKLEDGEKQIFKELRSRIPTYYERDARAIDPTNRENQKRVDIESVRRLIKTTFINAQRGLDDETSKSKSVLGNIFLNIFDTAKSDFANSAEKEIATRLEIAIKEIESQIDKKLKDDLRKLVPQLSKFGYPGLSDPGLLTETTLAIANLLKDHTKICYEGSNGVNLPEAFNGLGSRNLIYILLKLLEFFKFTKNHQGVKLIFIEEPEAHLHPQMQEVFIAQLDNICQMFSQEYNDHHEWRSQFVVSTHSSHVSNAAPFKDIRYFLTDTASEHPSLYFTKIKDLRKDWSGINEDFLHQYLTLTRCDLFFADKAILIEGTCERILLPKMIKLLEKKGSVGGSLVSQYISILEVGGAYAHRFNELLDFLELRTLVVTDLDCVEKGGGKKCAFSQSSRTSNATIKDWFEDKDITPQALIAKPSEEKNKVSRRVAYQIPESTYSFCGRSLEQAFMLANSSLFSFPGINLEEETWNASKDIDKTDFALKFAIEKDDWIVPLYIREGLEWLSENSLASLPLQLEEIKVPSKIKGKSN